MAHYGAAQFPALSASVGDLYGASSFRMCEAQEYALDLDALDREELALKHMVQALVERKAPVPIGVKFHRAPPPPSVSAGVAHGGDAMNMRQHGRRDAVDGVEGEEDDDEEEEDDDMEEDEMDEEDDEEEEDEDEGFPLDGPESEDDGALESGDDPFAHEDDSLDDVSMDMDTEQPRRETW